MDGTSRPTTDNLPRAGAIPLPRWWSWLLAGGFAWAAVQLVATAL